jgi:cytochrome c5
VPTCDAQTGTATPVPDAPAQCTSGKKWTSGNGPTMSPGDMCQGCHGFSIAGTVYPTLHETGLCNGINGGAQVVITPACGTPITLTVNNVGNFYYTGTVRQPFTAKVVVNGVERAMVTPQTLGDCNACHTQNGLQGAPGRIIVP